MTNPQTQQQLNIISESFKLMEKQIEQLKRGQFVDQNAALATIYDAVRDLRGLDSRITRLRSQVAGPFP